jgi:DNA helicase-2/ATP-dependent DNA helicase PcrA
VTTLRADTADTYRDAVELATFHAAKGLEWPVVFVVGLEQGLVPIGHADTPAARAEERRLLYVALTRAEIELHCSWAERRTFASRALPRSPSPYLNTIEAALAAMAAGDASADWRRHLGETRARIGTGAERPKVGARADPVVFTALKAWRANAARAAGVPAYVVLHDSTLAAVAEALPADRSGLLALPGVGPVKLERYGDALLAILATYRQATPA